MEMVLLLTGEGQRPQHLPPGKLCPFCRAQAGATGARGSRGLPGGLRASRQGARNTSLLCNERRVSRAQPPQKKRITLIFLPGTRCRCQPWLLWGLAAGVSGSLGGSEEVFPREVTVRATRRGGPAQPPREGGSRTRSLGREPPSESPTAISAVVLCRQSLGRALVCTRVTHAMHMQSAHTCETTASTVTGTSLREAGTGPHVGTTAVGRGQGGAGGGERARTLTQPLWGLLSAGDPRSWCQVHACMSGAQATRVFEARLSHMPVAGTPIPNC